MIEGQPLTVSRLGKSLDRSTQGHAGEFHASLSWTFRCDDKKPSWQLSATSKSRSILVLTNCLDLNFGIFAFYPATTLLPGQGKPAPCLYYSRCYHLVLLNRLEVRYTEPRARARGSAGSLASIETLQPG